jgi:hypothetical protein
VAGTIRNEELAGLHHRHLREEIFGHAVDPLHQEPIAEGSGDV